MESPERGALMLVRIIALALAGWAVAEIALYWAVCHHHNQPLAVGKVILKALPLIVGIIMLIKSRAIAEWLSEHLDL